MVFDIVGDVGTSLGCGWCTTWQVVSVCAGTLYGTVAGMSTVAVA